MLLTSHCSSPERQCIFELTDYVSHLVGDGRIKESILLLLSLTRSTLDAAKSLFSGTPSAIFAVRVCLLMREVTTKSTACHSWPNMETQYLINTAGGRGINCRPSVEKQHRLHANVQPSALIPIPKDTSPKS